MIALPSSLVTSNIQLEQIADMLGIKNFRVEISCVGMSKMRDGEQRIVNISKNLGQVEHWCLMSLLKGERYYFDSFGCVPPLEVIDALGGEFEGSDPQVQKFDSSECGIKCLYVAHGLNQGYSFTEVLYGMKQ